MNVQLVLPPLCEKFPRRPLEARSRPGRHASQNRKAFGRKAHVHTRLPGDEPGEARASASKHNFGPRGCDRRRVRYQRKKSQRSLACAASSRRWPTKLASVVARPTLHWPLTIFYPDWKYPVPNPSIALIWQLRRRRPSCYTGMEGISPTTSKVTCQLFSHHSHGHTFVWEIHLASTLSNCQHK